MKLSTESIRRLQSYAINHFGSGAWERFKYQARVERRNSAAGLDAAITRIMQKGESR